MSFTSVKLKCGVRATRPDCTKYNQTGKGMCLGTGDQDLLAVGDYQGIRIVTPRAFLQRLAP